MLDEGNYDIVHDHTNAGLLAAIRRGVPTVATVHGSPVGEMGDYLSSIDREVGLVSISHAQRRLNSALPWIATVHNGFVGPDPPKTTPGTGPVLWLARFIGDKGPDLAIEACRQAGMRLVLAGKCNEDVEQQYLDEVVKPMLGPDVEVVVNGGRERIRQLLMDASCLLLPLRWEEPFGMVLVEALASGTPVITLNRGSALEVVAHGKTGFVCEEPAELADALRRVGEIDPAVCAEHVRTQFSPDLMAERYERVYRRWAATVPPLRQFRRLQATTVT
jgi:glycosyltransferase involved in cell wall biosynthesis